MQTELHANDCVSRVSAVLSTCHPVRCVCAFEDKPVRQNLIDNMASGGDASDKASGKAQKPIYSGKASAFPAFEIKATSYAAINGWDKMLTHGELAPSSTSTARYYMCRQDGVDFNESLFTSKQIVDLVDEEVIEPLEYVVAKEGDSEWSQLARATDDDDRAWQPVGNGRANSLTATAKAAVEPLVARHHWRRYGRGSQSDEPDGL